MEYITSKVRKTLTNEPYILSASEQRDTMRQNQYDVAETQHVTESSKRGESYYKDGYPGDGKISDERLEFYKEVLYRDLHWGQAPGIHIDHQYGKIHGLAIDKEIHIAYSAKKNGVIELCSLNFPKRAELSLYL